MKSFVRSVAVAALAVFAIAGPAVPTSAAPIAYDLTNYTQGQNGYSVRRDYFGSYISMTSTGVFTNDASALNGWAVFAFSNGDRIPLSFGGSVGEIIYGYGFATLFGTLTATSDGLFLDSGSQLALYRNIDDASDGGIFWANTLPGN